MSDGDGDENGIDDGDDEEVLYIYIIQHLPTPRYQEVSTWDACMAHGEV